MVFLQILSFWQKKIFSFFFYSKAIDPVLHILFGLMQFYPGTFCVRWHFISFCLNIYFFSHNRGSTCKIFTQSVTSVAMLLNNASVDMGPLLLWKSRCVRREVEKLHKRKAISFNMLFTKIRFSLKLLPIRVPPRRSKPAGHAERPLSYYYVALHCNVLTYLYCSVSWW